jgi:hypothetical protein
MKPKNNGASQLLIQWLEEHPKLPVLTRHVMKSLASGDEAAAAWRVLGTDEVTVGNVINRVRSALEQALQEVNRPSVKDENTDLARIIKLITDLKREIKTTLPGDWCQGYELAAEGQKTVMLDLGWHSLRSEGYFGYPLSVVEVLDMAVEMIEARTKNLPIRAITRRGDSPEIQSFVRHLAWQFAREFKQEMRGTIAHITNAIFDPADPLDVSDVEGILKDRPAPFKAPT